VENVKKASAGRGRGALPEKMGYGDVQRVLRNLLRERRLDPQTCPRSSRCLADNAGKVKDADAMTELVRQRLGARLCEMHSDRDGAVHAVTLDPDIEQKLAAAVNGARDADASR
jgi:flagellar biosynthesis protein FlhA